MAFVEIGSVNMQRIEIPVEGCRSRDDQSTLFNSSKSSTTLPISSSIPVENLDSHKNKSNKKEITRNKCTTSSLNLSYTSQTVNDNESSSSPKSNTKKLVLCRNLVVNSESSNGLTRSRSHHSFRSIFSKTLVSTSTSTQSSPETSQTLRKSDSKSSLISNHSCLNVLLVQPLLNSEGEPKQKSSITSPLSSSAPSVQVTSYTEDEIESCKQRQCQLDRIIDKLIETMKQKQTKNLREISKFWKEFQHLLIQQIPQHNSLQFFFDYFYKMVQPNANLERLLNNNDEIKAAFQVLSSTLMILKSSRISINLNELFDREEKRMSDQLQYEFDLLRSSYIDEHRFLTACIQSYQNRSTDDDDYHFGTDRWMKILLNDYPILIEKISTDYEQKIPSIEQTLTKMLMNTKTDVIKTHMALL